MVELDCLRKEAQELVVEGLLSVGGRYEVYLGTGAEAKKAGLEDVRRSLNHRYLCQRDNRLYSCHGTISTHLHLAHKEAVLIQTLAAPRLDLPCFVPWYLTLWSPMF